MIIALSLQEVFSCCVLGKCGMSSILKTLIAQVNIARFHQDIHRILRLKNIKSRVCQRLCTELEQQLLIQIMYKSVVRKALSFLEIHPQFVSDERHLMIKVQSRQEVMLQRVTC